jgi:CPA2 family monovalent cation:H+ antiporter-2
VFTLIEPAQQWIRAQSTLARAFERSDDPLAELPPTVAQKYLSGQVVLVGYGRVGRRIAEAFDERQIPYVVAEQNRELVERLRERGIPAVSGDAGEPEVLIQAHIARAGMLVIATPDTLNVRKAVEIARTLNPTLEIMVRTHNEEEATLLQQENIGTVFLGEHELALGMVRHVLMRMGVDALGTQKDGNSGLESTRHPA